MKKSIGAKEAIFVTTVAAGFFIGGPLVAEASDNYLDPTKQTTYQFDENQPLRYGHTGYNVRMLQFELKRLNYYFDVIDGHFGPKTREAIKQFQQIYNLKVDGIANRETIRKLNEIITKPKPKILSKGDKGPEVELVQSKLKRLGYYYGKIDGIFGPQTEESVNIYLKKYKLDTIGILDEFTVDHIMKNPNVKGTTIKSLKVTKSNNPKVGVGNYDSPPPVNTSVISIAMKYLGIPYVWGGSSPKGFDCSGFLQYVFSRNGMTIPRTVSDIWNFGHGVNKISVGDIVFFQTYKPGPSHAGIYIGNGEFIHASSSRGISISSLSDSYWKNRYLGAKRVSN